MDKVMQPKLIKILSSEALEILEARKKGVTLRFLVETAIIELTKTEIGKLLIEDSEYSSNDEEEETNSTDSIKTDTPKTDTPLDSIEMDTSKESDHDDGDGTEYAFG